MRKTSLHFQRFEFKYYLPRRKADKLVPTLLTRMEWDPYILGSGRDSYRVRSLYFDTAGFGCFHDKESGLADRKKMRLRYYAEALTPDTLVFVEIKRKLDALVVKDRIQLTAKACGNGELDSALRTALRADPQNAFLHELHLFKMRNQLRPNLLVTYDRKALVAGRDKRFRVTFDYDITSQLHADLLQPIGHPRAVFPEGVVLELKFNNILPNWFLRIIQNYQLQRIAYSKYSNALRAVVPSLDDNNYKPN